MTGFYYKRPELTQEIVKKLLGEEFLSPGMNGLFLAAPRRTGKSSLLKRELTPSLTAKNIEVIYTDLWSNTKEDPGKLITESIVQSFAKYSNIIARAAKKTGIEKASFAGITINPQTIGQVHGATLPAALQALINTCNKSVALIIDEAQQALTTSSGENVMFALKSARDQINLEPDVKHKLMLVMSGSDRDKLMRLLNNNAAPFFGSSVYTMPLLGPDFVEFIAQNIERNNPALQPVDTDSMWKAFQVLGNKPELFLTKIISELSPLQGNVAGFEKRVYTEAIMQQETDAKQWESLYLGLSALQQSLIWRLLEKRSTFKPYDADALQFYASKGSKRFSPAQVQTALETMRKQSPPLVWKSARGEYALEDISMLNWFLQAKQKNLWPPKTSEINLQ